MPSNRAKDVNDLQWDDLKVFLAIARAGSLMGAARAIGQTQPTMGRRLQALERTVGCKLMRRTTEGFVPTDEGKAVLAHAERMEEEAVAFARRLAGRDSEVEGTLRVSSSEWFASHVLAPIFARIQLQHPRLEVELITETRLLNLDRREADLVFRFRRFEEAHIVQKRLTHVTYEAYASRDYLKQRGRPDPSTGGVGHGLITMDLAFNHLADVGWLTRLLPQARISGRSNSRDVQARMCAAGAGVAVLPCQLGEALPGLERVDLGEQPPGRDIWVGYHRDFQRQPRLRTLLDATEAAFAPTPGDQALTPPGRRR
ncbi:LysR family transcriptional regulator [Cystobacter fuscus]|uniref:LysR family transcriptional regulator n=1 Tax=Cystobacter fuscus TaxID=43 RepID=A0A250JL62_9BACT|nr:LysR family transcriptional regulator [Cystobacter fuscus]ATB44380.1 LysR family transcriptional regulator [Cystobacter fuscus]